MSGEMRALVVERPGVAAVQRVPRPVPGPGEVLVRVGAAGICGSDVEVLEGRRPPPYVRYPIIPGHEWAGTVEAVGPGIDGVAEGAVVVAEGFRVCGDCTRCREGRTNLCTGDYAETGFTHAGAFAATSSRFPLSSCISFRREAISAPQRSSSPRLAWHRAYWKSTSCPG
jgi:D-arabinose 1-dehydrogenase-like Zn-dependent alcohol dehydrogenase